MAAVQFGKENARPARNGDTIVLDGTSVLGVEWSDRRQVKVLAGGDLVAQLEPLATVPAVDRPQVTNVTLPRKVDGKGRPVTAKLSFEAANGEPVEGTVNVWLDLAATVMATPVEPVEAAPTEEA